MREHLDFVSSEAPGESRCLWRARPSGGRPGTHRLLDTTPRDTLDREVEGPAKPLQQTPATRAQDLVIALAMPWPMWGRATRPSRPSCSNPVSVFRTIPGIGPELARCVHDALDVDTLEALEAAAYDGRLEQVPNTAMAHELGRTRDWVVIYFYDDHHQEGQHTVVTETQGPLRGRRVVRGLQAECGEVYRASSHVAQVARSRPKAK